MTHIRHVISNLHFLVLVDVLILSIQMIFKNQFQRMSFILDGRKYNIIEIGNSYLDIVMSNLLKRNFFFIWGPKLDSATHVGKILKI